MVVTFSIQNILAARSRNTVITLPTFKEHGLKIDFNKDDDLGTVYNGPEPLLPFANSKLFHADICGWRRLTEVDDRCKSVYEVTFDVTGSNFTFKAGDTIGILPQNCEEEVKAVVDHLDLNSVADTPYKLSVDSNIKGCKISPHVPVQSTLSFFS